MRNLATTKNRRLWQGCGLITLNYVFGQQIDIPNYQCSRREVISTLHRHRALHRCAVVSFTTDFNSKHRSAFEEFHSWTAAKKESGIGTERFAVRQTDAERRVIRNRSAEALPLTE